MHRFRSKVKKGDIVGVDFGDEKVANRSVYVRLENSIIALDYNARTYREYAMSKVYLPDTKSTADVSGDLQELS